MDRAHDLHIATVGTLTIQVPADCAPLNLDDVHRVLMTEATQIMGMVCPGAGVQFMNDPSVTGPRTITGLLTMHASRAWGRIGIEIPREYPRLLLSADKSAQPLTDNEIAAELNQFAQETLVEELWGPTLALTHPGAEIRLGFRSSVAMGRLVSVGDPASTAVAADPTPPVPAHAVAA